MPIPLSVKHSDLMAALQPLYDLLGTSARNIYDEPGITIRGDLIEFNVPDSHESDPRGVAKGVRAVDHPQGDGSFAEQVHYVRVEVLR